MTLYVYPYRSYSQGANDVIDGIGAKKLHDNSAFIPKPHDLIINWGNSNPPTWNTNTLRWLNKPERVRNAVNKLIAFKLWKEASITIPRFTTSKQEAAEFFGNKKKKVLERTLLTSHSGKGIRVVEKSEDLGEASLYVEYIPKIEEYRLHVMCGEVIDIQEKRKKNGWKELKEYSSNIRSHDRGWTFCRENIKPIPHEARELAISAVASLGLDFGAVDIIYNGHQDKYYALEVNTSPGIEGETMHIYVNNFLNILETL